MKGGAPFESLARAFSRAGSAQSGGDMGWVRPDQLDNEWRPVLAGLQPGQVSIPFPSLGGYRILYLKAQRPASGVGDAKSSETVNLEQIHLPVDGPTAQSVIAKQMNSLRALTAEAKSCAEFRAVGLKTGSTLSGSLGIIKTSSLPQAIAGAIKNLAPNEPSQPILVEGGVVSLMVCERKSGNSRLDQIKQRLRNNLTNRKLVIAADKYLSDLRRDAFVDIRR